jgi:hypothetical protein
MPVVLLLSETATVTGEGNNKTRHVLVRKLKTKGDQFGVFNILTKKIQRAVKV